MRSIHFRGISAPHIFLLISIFTASLIFFSGAQAEEPSKFSFSIPPGISPELLEIEDVRELLDGSYADRYGVSSETESGTLRDNVGCFSFTSGTGTTYPVIVIDPTLNDESLEIGDVIAVYDGTLCVGAKRYAGRDTLAIAAWREITSPIILPGYTVGDTMSFAICDSSCNEIIENATPTYMPNGTGNMEIFEGYFYSKLMLDATRFNTPPIPDSLFVELPEDTSDVEIILTASDPQNDAIGFWLVTSPGYGTLSGEVPNLSYTPTSGFFGRDFLTFFVWDCRDTSAIDTVIIQVGSVNDPPEFEMGNTNLVSYEDEGEQTFAGWAMNISANESDQELTFELTGNYAGLFSVQPAIEITETTGDFTYTSAQNFHGIVTVSVVLRDNGGTEHGGVDSTETQYVTITVVSINDPPVANSQQVSTDEDTGLDIQLTASDIDSDSFSYEIIDQSNSGTTTITNASGEATYSPGSEFFGEDQFLFRVCDDSSACDTAMVSITVNPINDPPVADSQQVSTDEDTYLNIQLTVSDIDSDSFSYEIIDPPDSGTTTITNASTGMATYTPSPDYFGQDEFLFLVCDDSSACDTATVSITVNPINDPPVANSQQVSTDEDTDLDIQLTASDIDSDSFSYEIIDQSNSGTTTITNTSTGMATYTPSPDYFGQDEFLFLVCDDSSACDIDTISITVDPVNDPPVANSQQVSTDEDTDLEIQLTASDIDSEILSYQWESPNLGQLNGDTFDNLTYIPNENFRGSDNFLFYACDDSGSCDTATVSITVNPVNDPPVAEDQDVSVLEDNSRMITLYVSDIDSDSIRLTQNIVGPPPVLGSLSSLIGIPSRTTYSPEANTYGTDQFMFEVCDDHNACDTATVSITVNPINDPPIALLLQVTTDEDTPVSDTLFASDIDSDFLSYQIVDLPDSGSVDVSALPIFTYTPSENFPHIPFGQPAAQDIFRFSACDDSSACDTTVVTVRIYPDNDPPIADSQAVVTNEDAILSITLSGSDPDGNSLSYSIVRDAAPEFGTLSREPGESSENWIYTPESHFLDTGEEQIDDFLFQVCDYSISCDTAEVHIVITGVNDPPVAEGQSINMVEDTTIAITLTAFDSEDDLLTYVIQDSTTHGALTGTSPNIVYTPDQNYSGLDQFSFVANDGDLNSDPALITINISEGGNQQPIAQDTTITLDEDGTAQFSLTAHDGDGDSLTFFLHTPHPQHGEVDINSLTGVATYTPDDNYDGTDSFRFRARDHIFDSDPATVTILINPINDPPVVNSQQVSTDEDTYLEIQLAALDIDSDTLFYEMIDPPDSGQVEINNSTGQATYTPNPNYFGQDQFLFRVCDDSGACDIDTVSITVDPVNDPPVSDAQSIETGEDIDLEVQLTASDADSETLSYQWESPNFGQLNGDTFDNLVYTPNENFHGLDNFLFYACDDSGACDTAMVSITVNSINDPPVANSQEVSIDEDTDLDIQLTASDIDSDVLVYEIVNPTRGQAVIFNASTGMATYTPNPDFFGQDQFLFRVCDDSGACDIDTVSITVDPVNDPPVANSQQVSTHEDIDLEIQLTASDIDSETLSYQWESPSFGQLNGDTFDNLIYIPNENFHGPDNFLFYACDDSGACDIDTVSITVNPVNDFPTAHAGRDSTVRNVNLIIELDGQDVDGDPLAYTVTQPQHGALTQNGSPNRFLYDPDVDYVGLDSFTFFVSDLLEDSDPAQFDLLVILGDIPPIAHDSSYTALEDGSIPLMLTGHDPNGNPVEFAVIHPPNHGVLTGDAPDLIYTPTENFPYEQTVGMDSLMFTVNDGLYTSQPATVAIGVQNLNDPPVASGGAFDTDEHESVNITLDASDIDGDILIYTIITSPEHGAIHGDSPDNLSYTPTQDYPYEQPEGVDQFEFTACDGSECDTAVVIVTVHNVNDPPVANSQQVSTDEDTVLNIQLTASDIDGDELAYRIVDGPDYGGLESDPRDESIIYRPDPNYHGFDEFRFVANDGQIDSQPATVSLTVRSINDPPVANSQQVITNEDTVLNIQLTASDIDSDALLFEMIDPPDSGQVEIENSTGLAEYTPNLEFSGQDAFLFLVCDDSSACDTAAVYVTVRFVNDSPIAHPQDLVTDRGISVEITLTGEDPEGADITFIITSLPHNDEVNAGGELRCQDGSELNSCEGSPELSYIPPQGFTGLVWFDFKVNDGSLDSQETRVTIRVNDPGNHAPVAGDTSVVIDEDAELEIQLPASDVDGDELTYQMVILPDSGQATIDTQTGRVVYTPNPNFWGADSFIFVVSDDILDSPPAMVRIVVNPIPDCPIAISQALDIDEDNSQNIILSADDPDGDPLIFSIIEGPDQGVYNGDLPNIVYTPNQNFPYNQEVGADAIRYSVCDETCCDTADVVIEVTNINDAPVAYALTGATMQDRAVELTLTGFDVDEDILTFAIYGHPQHGNMSPVNVTSSTSAKVTYTPDTGYSGSDFFTFRVSDGDLISQPAQVDILVSSSAPVCADIPDTMFYLGDTLEIDLTNYVADENHSIDELSWSVTGNNNLVIDLSEPSRCRISAITEYIELTHCAGSLNAAWWTGEEELTFTVTDPGGLFDSDVVTVLVERREGDVDGDGIANNLDVCLLQDYILEDTLLPDSVQFIASDINGDGALDIQDVVDLIDMISEGTLR
ncbi:MAG: hypothetical protein B6244_03910 [Candidatus Cloacimonetes bacterium 4572_55]|nr:MAG: hypothetical protein B6244_03910 [Candidatus Cloacimonetes bacterium 4572_55]